MMMTRLQRPVLLFAAAGVARPALQARRAASTHLSVVQDEIRRRYRDRLQRRANEQGFETVEELARFHKVKAKLPQFVQAHGMPAPAAEPAASSGPARDDVKKVHNPLASRKLTDILNMDKLPPKATGEDVAKIWTAYHSMKNLVSGVAKPDVYRAFRARARECPLFVIPVAAAAEGPDAVQAFYLLAHNPATHQTYFTPLAAYQRDGDFAAPCFVLTHYPELEDSHGVVLFRSEDAAHDQRLGRALVETMRRFYVDGHDWELVQRMNKDPAAFDHNDVVAAVSKAKLQ